MDLRQARAVARRDDHTDRHCGGEVHVDRTKDRTKDQTKDAPEFDASRHGGEPPHLKQFAKYYRQPHM
ncbi:hypothetical protein Sros01_78010 [Streptomyces roseochromogenus]|nr:hypothetical protein Sros01_78010 [Streptomyces roseochromogenus]